MQTETKEIMERGIEYFGDLLDCNRMIVDNSEQTQGKVNFVEEEIANAINTLKVGEEPGINEITLEMVKHMGIKGQQIFQHLFNLERKECSPRLGNIGKITKVSCF